MDLTVRRSVANVTVYQHHPVMSRLEVVVLGDVQQAGWAWTVQKVDSVVCAFIILLVY